MTEPVDLVHVIFKTHLDVGFTDYAHTVVQRYFREFIPAAIALARRMAQDFPDDPFCWTIGSWLVVEYLKQATPQERQSLEQAVADGHLAWHALPFTTHTELMDADLFRHGLSLSAELDARYSKQTIAAKMTDVPGHTRAMIPLMAEVGVKFLHIGVNAAATVPDVPPIFIWRDEATDSEIIVMYQHVYGASMVLPGLNEAVSLVFTGDNLGPPSIESVHQTYAQLRREFPGARFIGSNLDAVARRLLDIRDTLPVITEEIGDTWIHGVGSDPTKVSQYRALLRLRHQWMRDGKIDAQTLGNFQDQIMLVPEHTWGLDLKTHLTDYEHYDTEALASVRDTPKFQFFEGSWYEQRAYLTSALETLHGELHGEAQQALEAILPQRPDLTGYSATTATRFSVLGWHIEIDAVSGAIIDLRTASGITLADATHPLAVLRYETFSAGDYDRYWHQYIREHGDVREWAHPDNAKPGLKVDSHGMWFPEIQKIYSRIDDDIFSLVLEATFAEDSQQIGAPRTVFIDYQFTEHDTVNVRVQWFEKPACRLPEAFWMSFNPPVRQPENWQIEKLGEWLSPLDVVSKGGRTLHAVDSGVRYHDDAVTLNLTSLDAPLVAPGQPSLLNFHDRLPDLAQGMHFNLFNNVWGTNFPMWFDDDALFRFVLEA